MGTYAVKLNESQTDKPVLDEVANSESLKDSITRQHSSALQLKAAIAVHRTNVEALVGVDADDLAEVTTLENLWAAKFKE